MAMSDDTLSTSHAKSMGMFSRPSLLLAAFISILPNLLFVVASPFFAVTRLLSPLLYLAVGIAGLFLPTWLVFALFLAVFVVDLSLVIMVMFHLPLDVALDSAKYLATIDIKSSAFYLFVLGVTLCTTCAAAYLLVKNRTVLRSASLLPATLTTLAIVGTDLAFTFPYYDSNDLPFESAMKQNGLTAETLIERDNNLLIVMIEGLGAFKDSGERAIFANALQRGLDDQQYTFKAGSTFYSGSTTGAASRELCGQWGDYLDYLGQGTHNCLPRQLADSGYSTVAYHGFKTEMFKRDDWYPRIGFSELNFMDTMQHLPTFDERCGSVFEGLCDLQIGDAVHRRMTDGSEDKKFVYWLTLNSHIPFVKSQTDHLSCRTTPRVKVDIVCELSNLWLPIFDKVNAIATDPKLPPTDILIVGDHHTPLWERAAKKRFVQNQVDWYLLEAKK